MGAVSQSLAEVSLDGTAAREERLDWLQGRLPVPQAIAYEASEQSEYLLLTALPGRDAASLTGDEPDENIVDYWRPDCAWFTRYLWMSVPST